MTKEAHLADGTVLEFPDETPDDVMDASVQQEMAMRRRQTGTAPEDRRGPNGMPGSSTEPVPADQQLPLPQAQASAPPEPSLVDKIVGTGDVFARKTSEGVLNTLGIPVDLVNNAPRLLNMLPGVEGVGKMSDTPLFGGDFNNAAYKYLLDSLSKTVGIDRQPLPPDEQLPWYQRLAGRVGQEVGGAMVPGGGALMRAAGTALPEIRAAMPEAETLMQSILGAPKKVFNQMTESAAVNPGKFVKNEGIAATAAGTGAGAIDLYGPDPKTHPTAAALLDLVGAVLGAGTVGGVRSAVSHSGDLINALRGSAGYVDNVVKEAVVDRIAEAANLQKRVGGTVDTDPLVQAIEGSPKVSDTVPGVQESLADRTKNPGLAALEYSRQSGPNSGMFTAKRNENDAAIASAIEAQAPTETPGAFRSELEAQRAEQLATTRQATQQAQDALTAASGRLSATMTGEARGADIRAALEHSSEAAQEIVREAWRPINESPHLVDPTPLAEQYGAAGEQMSIAERRRFRPSEADIPGQLAGDQAPVETGLVDAQGQPITRAPEPTETTLNEITGIRSALTDQARVARTNGEVNKARIMEQHITALDDYLDANVPRSLRTQYEAARDATRDYSDRFARPQTGIAQTLQRTQGQPTLPDSAIARKFVQDDQGNIANFQSLMRESGADPRVQGAIRDQVLQDVADRGLLQNPQELDAYLGRYRTLFSSFPELRTELGNAGALRRTVQEAETTQAATERSLGTPERPGSSATGKYLSYSEENADRAMANVMASKDPVGSMDELLNQVKNQPQAVEGAKRAFWNLMEKKARSTGATTKGVSGEQPWRATSLKNFLDDPRNAGVLARLYKDDPTHLDNLKQIVESVQGLDTKVAAKARNTSGTAQSVLPSAETIGSRLFAFKRGQVGPGFLVTSVGATIMRRLVGARRTDAINRMLDQALLDPEAAKVLLKENNPANRAALRRWAKGWWGAEGAAIMNSLSADESDQGGGAEENEAVDAIQRAGGKR